jgi:hypothetical protein
MRKRKRAALKLKAAKKAASVMAESNEVSEKQKLKVRSLYNAVLSCRPRFCVHGGKDLEHGIGFDV